MFPLADPRGRSRRPPSPMVQNFLNFMQFLGNFEKNCMSAPPPKGWSPLLRKSWIRPWFPPEGRHPPPPPRLGKWYDADAWFGGRGERPQLGEILDSPMLIDRMYNKNSGIVKHRLRNANDVTNYIFARKNNSNTQWWIHNFPMMFYSIFTARKAESTIFTGMCHSVHWWRCIPACTWAGDVDREGLGRGCVDRGYVNRGYVDRGCTPISGIFYKKYKKTLNTYNL